MPKFNEMGVSINLPSLKVDKKTLPVIKTISDVRKSSLTFAIETAGTDMRKIIHKRIHNNELIEILTEVINNGWKKIKLYFMLGLPGYEDHDEVNNTIELLHTINNIRRNRVEINVAISPFVPKPHTPFQWEKMAEPQYFYDSIREIKKRVPKNVSVKFHNIDSIVIEAVLARGDTKISDVILSAYQKGCRLDSWDEFFKKDLWYKSLEENIPDWKKYISVRDNDFVFPWNVINSVNPALIKNKKEKILSDAELSSLKTEYDTKLDFEKINSGFEKFKVKYNTAVVYRGMYEKKGYAKYISHLDLIEVLKRTMRMAGMPLSYTQGFNKREIISFGYPLPLGTESASEEFEFACYQRIDIDETIRKCNEHCIDGVKILSITESKHTSSIMAEIKSFTYEIFVQDDSANINTIGIFELLNNTSHLMKTDKSGNTKQYNFSDVVIKQAMVNDKIYATIRSEGITMKINDILKQVSDLPITSYGIIKISNNR